jgi:hypothetical protein
LINQKARQCVANLACSCYFAHFARKVMDLAFPGLFSLSAAKAFRISSSNAASHRAHARSKGNAFIFGELKM